VEQQRGRRRIGRRREEKELLGFKLILKGRKKREQNEKITYMMLVVGSIDGGAQ